MSKLLEPHSDRIQRQFVSRLRHMGFEPKQRAALTSTRTWTMAKTYIIDGRGFVTDGVTRTIEPGTSVKGRVRADQDASAMVIARGG